MKFVLNIDCDNDAFATYPEDELVRILAKLARDICINGIRKQGEVFILLDKNGNKVGEAELTKEFVAFAP